MNLRDVGSETSVNDTVQTNKNDKYIYIQYANVWFVPQQSNEWHTSRNTMPEVNNALIWHEQVHVGLNARVSLIIYFVSPY